MIPLERLLRLRRLGGLDGHPDVGVPGIEANSGSLGMGISKARGIAWAKRHLGRGGRVVVMVGDGELQEGQNYEGLQAAAHERLAGLTVIVDRNELQSDKPTDEIVSLGVLEDRFLAFGWHVRSCDGHDFAALREAFAALGTHDDRPQALVARTIKGKGVSFMEHPAALRKGEGTYRWHAGAPDDASFELAVAELTERIGEGLAALGLAPLALEPVDRVDDADTGPLEGEPESGAGNAPRAAVTDEYVVDAYGDELVRLGAEREDLVVLDADLASDCRVRGFELAYPDRFVECGIAEQDMVSTAAGLARHGLLPVVNSFASFLASRANEQIYNQASERTKVVYALHYAGLIPAGPGKSHQSVRDISLLGALPGTTVVQPGNGEQARALLRWAVSEAEGNVAIRLAIGPSPRRIELPLDVEPGCGHLLRDGGDAVLVAYGPVMLNEALTAAELLEAEGLGLAVLAMPWLNRVEAVWLEQAVRGHEQLFVLGGSLSGRRPRRRVATRASRSSGRSSRSGSRAGRRVGRRPRRFATIGSTVARLRRESRRGSAPRRADELQEGVGRPPRPALDPPLRRHRDPHRPVRPPRRWGRLPCSSVTAPAGQKGRVVYLRSMPRSSCQRHASVAERLHRSVDRRLDRSIGYYPLAIRLSLRHGFHRERIAPGHENWMLDSSRAGPLPRWDRLERRMAAWHFGRTRYVPRALRERMRRDCDALVLSNVQPQVVVPFLVSARRLGIPIVAHVASWDHTVGKGVIAPFCDVYIVQNATMRDDLIRYHDIDHERIVVTGWPQTDVYARQRPRADFDAVVRSFDLDPALPLVVVMGNTPTNAPFEDRFVERIVRWWEEEGRGRMTLLFRPHPRDRAWEERFAAALAIPGVHVQEASFTDLDVLATILQHAVVRRRERRHDLARGARQRPPGRLRSLRRGRAAWRELGHEERHRRALPGARSVSVPSIRRSAFEDVVSGIERSLAPRGAARRARRVVAEIVGEVDGRAAERVMDAIVRCIGRKAVRGAAREGIRATLESDTSN